MTAMAPRLLSVGSSRWSRGAWQALCLWLALLGASLPAFACGEITARYVDPTSEYPHGVLGDAIEWKALEIGPGSGAGSLVAGSPVRISAGPDAVFEDIAPRLWDITGDGCPEIVAIQSHQRNGARLVVFVYDGDKVDVKYTPFIGTRFRWLAPVGAADMDGDGAIEVALIDRPHLAKTLRIFRFHPVREDLIEVAQVTGLTNHRIGWDFIPGGVRDCGDVPEWITADANWQNVMATRLKNTTPSSRAIAPYTGPESLNAAMRCP